ncbi:MAG: Ca2+-binding RTX toxin-like protein, partial [Gammaproteobacteria bacterium]
DDDNGFAAVVFKNNFTNQITVSFRGTDDPNDWVANFEGLLGADFSDFIGSQTDNISTFLDSAGLFDDEGKLLTGVNFAGHSLGGYLATMASYKYVETLGSTSTFNGLGISLLDFFSNEVIGSNSLDGKVSNYYADIVGAIVGFHPGTDTKTFIENESAVKDHSISKLVKSLSVYRVLAVISPSLDLDKIYTILDAASPVAEGSLDMVIEQLSQLLGGDLPANAGDVELFYHNLLAESGGLKPEYQGLTIASLTETAAALNLSAQNSIAHRYTLVNLNSFIITGNDAIYDIHNQPDAEGVGSLDLESFSADYLIDRSQLLFEKLRIGLRDPLTQADGSYKVSEVSTARRIYEDRATNLTIDLDPLQTGIYNPAKFTAQHFIFGSDANEKDSEALVGGKGGDHLYGGGGDDELVGGKGGDVLEGGADNDFLYHNDNLDTLVDDFDGEAGKPSGVDKLFGGTGNDTYYVGQGDIINDIDKDGVINAAGIAVSGELYRNIVFSLGNEYILQEDDKSIVLTLEDTEAKVFVRNNITNQSATFTMQNIKESGNSFANGNFGITLNDQPEIATDLALLEGTNDDDSLTGTEFDDEIQGLDGNDNINGDAGNDLIVAGIGDDNANGGIGNDILQLGDGNDDGVGGEGDDQIHGGLGDDFLFGGLGNDIIIGGAGRDVLMSTEGDDVFIGGDGDDFLSGDEDNDFLNGGNDNDFLAGGGGIDALFGGNGDDILFGDGTYSALDRDWLVTVTDTLPTEPGGKSISFNDSIVGSEDSLDDQSDLLDGGLGDDILSGGGGNDQLFGGDGQDDLEGGEGDDRLEGGAGDDALFGDSFTDNTFIGNDIILGGDGNDLIVGGLGDDNIDGGLGDDSIFGDLSPSTSVGGDDIIDAGAGNDIVSGGGGDDIITGGAGEDQVLGEDGNDFIDGGSDNDVLSGGAGDDTLIGGDGDDQINGGDDNDTVFGDAGADTILGGAGDDIIDGGDGVDSIDGGDGNDEIHAGGDNDTNVLGGEGDDTIFGDAGDDILFGQAGDDQLFGGSGNDQLVGDVGSDVLDGGDGDDALFGQADNDILSGGAGLDTLVGGDGDDTLSGGSENDTLFGEGGNDSLSGDEGDDFLQGDAGNDSVTGGSGADVLFGGSGFDVLNGGSGNDELQGGSDGDFLNGDVGDDTLFGDGGSDTLHGGTGDDLLFGDAGDDVFRFEIGDGQDRIIEQGDTLGDSILLGVGIIPTETFISRINNDLIITHNQDFNDRLTVENWFGDIGSKVDHIEFADGTIWDQATIESNINLLPTANNDVVSGDEDTDIIILSSTLTANDTDPDNDPLTVVQVENAVNGTVALDLNGDVVFTPDQDFTGNAFFDYTMSDSRGGFDVATATVNVNNINDAPEAQVDTDILLLKPTDITIPPNGEPVLTGKDEILINSTTQGTQSESSITSLSNGGYVVIWRDTNPGSSFGINGQLFDELGNKINSEFQVSTNRNFVERPSVAALSDGGFITVWSSRDIATGDDFGIAAQRFDAAGNKTGTEFLVNTLIVDIQWSPVVTGLDDGGFVVTWVTEDPISGGPSPSGVAGQRYDAGGNAVGTEFLVNTGEVFISSRPIVASLSNGGFIFVWDGDSSDADGGFSEISYQLFGSNGNTIGGNVIANTNDVSNQAKPSISSLIDGNFVITWDSRDIATGDAVGVAGQLFDVDGNKIGTEFLVNTTTFQSQSNPDVTSLSDGGFVVSWTTQEITDGPLRTDIAAQRFDVNGNKIDNEFIVSEFVGDNQSDSAVTALSDGGFAFAWTSNDPATGGSGNDIAGRVYRYEVPPATDNTISVNVLANDLDVDDNILTFTLDTVSLQGTKGEASIVNNQLFYDAGADFEFLDEGDTDTVIIDYTMSDDDGATSASTATITIQGVNDLPFLEGEVLDQITDEDTPFNFTLSSGIFRDPDADDSLTFTATLSDDSALPAWLSFDPNTQTFSGAPLNDDVGIVDIQITATDNFPEAATETFSLTINNTNDQPVVDNQLIDQFINASTAYNFTVPSDTFSDVDVGDTLTYDATLVNGDSLPAWLSFDSQTQQFSGTPSNNDNGIISVEVNVTDNSGASISDSFDLTVNGIPELGTDSFDTLVDTDITISVAELLENDNDPDGDPLSVDNFHNVINGSINLTPEGDVLFSPLAGFNGAASFDYTVSDGRGGLSTQAVTINVLNSITGDAGDNILNGTPGNDLIDAGAGNDIINANAGEDILFGGVGDDVLNGEAGNDVLDGGSGNNTLTGGLGNDIYLFGEGGGNDIIIETDTAEGGDILRFANNIAAADVEIIRDGKHLVFTLKSTGESITLQQWKAGKGAYLISVEFGDGTVFNSDDLNINQKLGKVGDDTVRGSRNNDRLYGFEGNNTFIAKDGDDLLDGGAGNDLLQGMSGNDTYQFTSGWGNDVIVENDIDNDPSSGNIDTVAFGSGITSIDLLLERNLDDLRVTQLGTTDTIDIQDWYLGSEFQTEIFRDSQGSALMNTQVDQLIQAMASFSVDTGLNWSDAAQQRPEDVETIVAAAWQPAV